jgi:DNA recombination protein RmuC
MILSANEWVGLYLISLVLLLILLMLQRHKIKKLKAQVFDYVLEAKNLQHEADIKVSELNVLLSERDFQHQKQLTQFEDQKKILEKEFEVLANRIFEDKGKTFTQTSQASIENLLKPFREQISDFRQRVDGIQKENNESSGGLRKELEQLRQLNQKMTSDAQNLTEALKGDKKKVGGWGEVQLEKTLQLAGLVKGDHYESQAHFKDEHGKNNFPDFVVNLPDNKHVVIDSKVSLVDYDAAIAAKNDDELQTALNNHVSAVKNHIDGLSTKDYSNLIGMHSPSFVLMFMPIEPAYIEAMKHSQNLYDYAYQKGVILVSHTTLMPILRTVSNLWMVERSNVEAKEISERAGDVYQQVCLLADRLLKLGGTLQTASKQYNQAVVALSGQQGLHGKVERFSKISNKVTKTMPPLESIHTDIELERLEALSSINKANS